MKRFLLGAITLAIITVVVLAVVQKDTVFGSVAETQEYDFSRVTITQASSTVPLVLSSGNGSLGSIVIASSTYNGSITLYNATSTEATSTAQVITTFTSNQTPGTWTFDVSTPKGLKVWVDKAFDGEFIITYR